MPVIFTNDYNDSNNDPEQRFSPQRPTRQQDEAQGNPFEKEKKARPEFAGSQPGEPESHVELALDPELKEEGLFGEGMICISQIIRTSPLNSLTHSFSLTRFE